MSLSSCWIVVCMSDVYTFVKNKTGKQNVCILFQNQSFMTCVCQADRMSFTNETRNSPNLLKSYLRRTKFKVLSTEIYQVN